MEDDPLALLVRAVERLRLDVDEHEARWARLRDHAMPTGPAPADPTGADPTGADPTGADPTGTWPTWEAWSAEWLVPRVTRHPHRFRWCRRYAEHPEVAVRLEALWLAWREQWPRATGRVAWLESLDHQLAVVMSPDGPLRECSAAECVHRLPPPLGGSPTTID